MWREEVVGGGLDCGQGAARLGSYPAHPSLGFGPGLSRCGGVHRCTPKTRGPLRAWFRLHFSGHAFIVSVESFSLQTGIGSQVTRARSLVLLPSSKH